MLKEQKRESLLPTSQLFNASAESGYLLIEVLRNNAMNATEDAPPYDKFADSLDALATGLAENADALHEGLPKLEVPLPAFHIAEYHEGAAENNPPVKETGFAPTLSRWEHSRDGTFTQEQSGHRQSKILAWRLAVA